MTAPAVSVVIRSFNRLGALAELVDALLAQDHPDFEVVVVEQSTERPAAAVARLDALARDPRLRIVRRPPLGGARARNEGVAHARGDVLVFIDDDDLPVGADFLRRIEAAVRCDPNCLAVTCRQEAPRPRVSRAYRWVARRLCMRFSWLLRLPHVFPDLDQRIEGVDYVHGTGGAIRRDVFDRFGGWDEDTPIEDETSLGIRISRGLAPGEYLAFDPRATVRRRLGLAGGLAKRALTPGGYYRKFMTFVHRILGRYHPWRVRFLYPLYVLGAAAWTIGWLWDHSLAHDTAAKRLVGAVAFVALLPWYAATMARVGLGRRLGTTLAQGTRSPPS